MCWYYLGDVVWVHDNEPQYFVVPEPCRHRLGDAQL